MSEKRSSGRDAAEALWGDVRRRPWLAVAGLVVLGLAFLLLWSGGGKGDAPQSRPLVAYMSSLPLAFGEGGIETAVSGQSGADPFYLRLVERYDMRAVDDLERLPDMAADALLLVQPRALAPAENVALDRWVNAGGDLLLLTDPALMRESAYSLGDKRRPLFTSMASPLLAHWGLELILPMDETDPLVERSVAGKSFETRAPGALRAAPGNEGNADCDIRAGGLVARCAVGEGRAIVLADADLIDPLLWQQEGLFGTSDGAVRLIESYLDELTHASD